MLVSWRDGKRTYQVTLFKMSTIVATSQIKRKQLVKTFFIHLMLSAHKKVCAMMKLFQESRKTTEILVR